MSVACHSCTFVARPGAIGAPASAVLQWGPPGVVGLLTARWRPRAHGGTRHGAGAGPGTPPSQCRAQRRCVRPRTRRCPRRARAPPRGRRRVRGHAAHVRLDHHREQRPVDATSPLKDRGEEAAPPQLADPQLHVAGLGRQQPGRGAVALVRARVRPLVALGADHLGGLRFDERLEHHPDAASTHIAVAACADGLQQLGRVRGRQPLARDESREGVQSQEP